MKRSIVMLAAIAVISLFLLAGCKPQGTPEPDVSDNGADTTADDDTTDDTNTVAPDDNTDTTPAPVMSKELTKILSGLDKIKSYSYAYQSGTPESRQFSIKGDKILVTLMTKDKWKSTSFRYDKVLLDTVKEEAYGFCTDRGVCNSDERSIAKKVSYSEYAPPLLPMEYARSITGGDIVMTENFENQPATVIEFEEGANTVQVSLSNYYGIPLRIVTISPSGAKKDVQFNRMAINGVADTDVEYPAEIKTFEDE